MLDLRRISGGVVWGALTALAIACALGLASASTGHAAFPGGNGALITNNCVSTSSCGLYLVDSSYTPRLLASTPDASRPQWSPQGDRIIYAVNTTAGHALRIVNADGSGDRSVPVAAGLDFLSTASDWGWMRNGTHIVHTYESKIRTIDVSDGSIDSEVDLFSTQGLFIIEVVASPTSDRLAITYSSTSRDERGMALIDVDGQNFVPLKTRPYYDSEGYEKLTWAPDGTRLAYLHGIIDTSINKGTNRIEWIVPTPTATPVVVTQYRQGSFDLGASYHDRLVWSPAGDWILFRTVDGTIEGPKAAWSAIRPSGTDLVEFDRFPVGLDVDWQPCTGGLTCSVFDPLSVPPSPPPEPDPPSPPAPLPPTPPVTPPGPAPGDTPGVALDSWPGFRLRLTPRFACGGGTCTSVRQRVANDSRYSRRTFSQVYSTLNDGTMKTKRCPVSNDEVGDPEVGFTLLSRLCFPKEESTWLSQGLAGSHERRTADSPGGTWLVVSWCHRGGAKSCSAATETKTRVTLVRLAGAGAKRFGHVELTEPACSREVGRQCTLKALSAHAGGAAVAGRWLYVADTDRVLVFDLSFFLVDRQGEPVLPLDHSFEVRDVGGPPGRRGPSPRPAARTTKTGKYLSSLSIDANGSLVVAQYLDTKHDALVARFPLTSDGRLVVTGGRVYSTAVYTIDKDSDIDKVQGVASARGTLLFSTSRARLERARPNTVRQEDDKCIRWGQNQAQDLYASPATGVLWGINEYPGDRTIWSVNHAQAFGLTDSAEVTCRHF